MTATATIPSIPTPPTASSVIARARKLAAFANQIDDDVRAHSAEIATDDYHAWVTYYAQTAAPTIDPYTDPAFGIVANPMAAWANLDPVETALLDWRTRVNGWTGLTRPGTPGSPLPSVPLPDPETLGRYAPSGAVLGVIALGLVAVIVVTVKVFK